jgi:hypothetical protein
MFPASIAHNQDFHQLDPELCFNECAMAERVAPSTRAPSAKYQSISGRAANRRGLGVSFLQGRIAGGRVARGFIATCALSSATVERPSPAVIAGIPQTS